MHRIEIEKASNGFIIQVGCKTFVTTDEEKMWSELKRYVAEPRAIEQEYRDKYPEEHGIDQPQIVAGGAARVPRNY